MDQKPEKSGQKFHKELISPQKPVKVVLLLNTLTPGNDQKKLRSHNGKKMILKHIQLTNIIKEN